MMPGEINWVDNADSIGRAQSGRRPAVIFQDDTAFRVQSPLVLTLPLTTEISRSHAPRAPRGNAVFDAPASRSVHDICFETRVDTLTKMVYIIKTEHRGIKDAMLCAPVGPNEQDFLRKTVFPRMQPLSSDEYLNGPAAILSTAAPYSYVLHNNDVYWCVQWNPGLLVISFAPDGTMKWTNIRSPNPRFGGRKATIAEIAVFDEDEFNPQYNLIYDAWDEQFEEREREHWQLASSETAAYYTVALAPVNSLHLQLESGFGDGESEKWREKCQTSPIWKGDESTA